VKWGDETFWEFDTKFIQVVQRTPSVKTFRLDTRGQQVDYKSGQFFFITIKINGKEANHHFTISSSPTEKGYIEFTKRITPHEFSQALNVLQPGEWAHVRGPSGYFTLPDKPQKLGFLSGGIGITPMRSMLRYVADNKLGWDIVLLYGNSSYEEIVFRDELEQIRAASPGIRVENILSGPDFPQDWKGKRGMINKDLITQLVSDYKERIFYISGPPKMVILLEEQLSALNVPREQIKRDSFTGYD
jgi:glycine betaine catabolism B